MSDMNRKAEEMANDAALLLWAGSRPPAYDELVTTIMHTILQFAEQYAQEKNRELVKLEDDALYVRFSDKPVFKTFEQRVTLCTYYKVVGELEEASTERDEALEALREIYMLCGNPDPSDGEGTTPQEVTDSVRATLNKLIDAVPHTNCGSDDCFRCGFLEVKAENPALFDEQKGPKDE
jgi:hypothetical protein